MKKGTVVLLVFLALILSLKQSAAEGFDVMQHKFTETPKNHPLAAYWYWMNGNISEEGVIKDLHAMKEVGINRVHIGMIGDGQGVPQGKVRMFTRKWWKIMHTMFKTATELDIEVGLFNCPGWSQSGGPWVKHEQSMRYLAAINDTVKGPVRYNAVLPSFGDQAQDVKVLAYPVIDSQANTIVADIVEDKTTIFLTSKDKITARSMTIYFKRGGATNMELAVHRDSGWVTIDSHYLDRSNTNNNVGFTPLAPYTFSLPEINGNEFRVTLGNNGFIRKIEISSTPKVEFYAEKTLAKMYPHPLPMWDTYLWRDQPNYTEADILEVSQVQDITKNVSSDGTLTWDVPEGEWVISRNAMVTTGVVCSPAPKEGTGLETDKMSKEHIRSHFDNYLGKILERIPAEDRRTFRIVVEDSYETGGQNWTDKMTEAFMDSYGYDPTPFIPALNGTVVGSPDMTDRFLWDLRRLVADMIAYEYVAGLREVSHEHGLTTWLENYGHWGFPGEFLQYGGQSDEIAGEFWSFGDLGNIENKAASSCGHIYGKNLIWAESCTCGGSDFNLYPATMKQRIDRFFTEGINATLLHLYIQQPDDRTPGINALFGNEFNRNNTWFSQLDTFLDYLKRCNYMLQNGRYIADVAYFIGEDTPKMTGVRDPEIPDGYSYDYVNAEVLMKAKAREGKLVLESEMEYSILVLPKVETMRPELLAKISELVHDGAILLGPAPLRSPSLENYPEADLEVKKTSDAMWGEAHQEHTDRIKYGKGYIYPQGALEDIFADLEIQPDFSVSNSLLKVPFIHLSSDDGEIYFISNQTDETISFDATFRVQDMQPELWNPTTSEVRYLPQFKMLNGTTSLPMTMNPYESAFIVFRKPAIKLEAGTNFPDPELITCVNGPWTIEFEENRGGPKDPIITEQLFDWIDSENPQIRHFSGTARYTASFTIDSLPKNPVYIDLGNVMVMAKVYINGHDAGGVWTSPYQLNITHLLKEGDNTVEIEVVNCWRNRMIGECSMPKRHRFTYNCASRIDADSPLQSSGLLGPVKIISYEYKNIE